ncbi:MAG: ARMT1-like domain-containing protein [Bacillota bacterium]|nr:ARMT1-like domain-containing protein [Bacillota bacterium]
MKVCAECIPCYLKQSLNAINQVELEDSKRVKLIKQILPLIAELDQDKTPAENSSLILHKINNLLDNRDPFQQAKAESNQAVMKLWPKLREILDRSEDRLFTAFKLAVAGNVIDLGIMEDYDIDQSIQEALQVDFAINHYQELQKRLAESEQILIIGDNSGEIAFDRLLVEELNKAGVKIVYGVKGQPILNDATIKDAHTVKMNEIAKVITNGNSFLGTVIQYCSKEFLEKMAESDIVISKGQANYESLEGTAEAGEKTFFILRAKCDVVAASLGVRFGQIVLKQNETK